MRPYLLAALAAISLFTSGCGTMMRGTKQLVTFDSTPQGAEVLIDGVSIGKTPISTQVKRSEKSRAEFVLDGYERRTLQLTTEKDWVWTILGNGLLSYTSTTGTTTDVASNAHIEYSPNSHFIQLKRTGEKTANINEINHSKITHYVLSNYANIIAEIAQGGGHFISGLQGMLSEREGTILADELIANLRTLHASESHPPRFAERVALIGL